MLLVCLAPSSSLAATLVTLSLDHNQATVGEIVYASGVSDASTWVTIKVVNSLGDIVVLDVAQSDSTGKYSYTFKVPDDAGVLTVVAGYGSNVATAELQMGASTTGSINGTVMDGTTAIEGATVSLTVYGTVYSATSDSSGGYSITGIPPGTGYIVTAVKDAYSTGIATGVSVTANTTTQDVNITVSCLVTYRGAQMRTNADGTYDIRFLATIDTLDADAVGFVFSKSEQNPTKENVPSSQVKSTTTVYNSVTAAGSTVTAASLGGTYIIACTVTGIPASQADIPLYVRAFVTKGTETTYTAVRTVTINSLKP